MRNEPQQITLIVPVYNGERYLCALLDSVAAQSCRDWKCICVDDGSTDNSAAILQSFADTDSRFQVIRQKNASCGFARNAAIARATTPYIMFADQDDLLHPRAFECALSLIEHTTADAACFKAAPFSDNFAPSSLPQNLTDIPLLPRKLPPQDQFVKPRTGCSIFVWRHIFRRAAIADIPFPPLSGGEDAVWFVELGWRGVNIIDAPVVLYGNRHHADSGSRGLSRHYIDNVFQSYAEMRERGIKYNIDPRRLKRFLFRLAFWFTASAFYHGPKSGFYALKIFLNPLKGYHYAKRTEGIVSERCESKHRIVNSFASRCQQAVSDFRDIRMLARTCATERGRNLRSLSEDPIRLESKALIEAARQCGCLIKNSSVPGTHYTLRSGESDVRLNEKEQYYYKIKNPFAKLNLKKHPPAYVLFEHIVHNILFPECQLKFMGVTEELREARIVYRQQAVPSDMRPTDCQIAEELKIRGLSPDGRCNFTNNYVIVTDVGQDSDNVLIDDNDSLRFIDPIIGFKEPLQKVFNDALSSELDVPRLIERICCA